MDLVNSRVLLCSRDLFLHLKLVSKRLFTHAHATESFIVCFLDSSVNFDSFIAHFNGFSSYNNIATIFSAARDGQLPLPGLRTSSHYIAHRDKTLANRFIIAQPVTVNEL